jgi:hypothetical protein
MLLCKHHAAAAIFWEILNTRFTGGFIPKFGTDYTSISRVSILQIKLYVRRRIHVLSLLTYVAK